jgi:hypothetical protein
VEMVTSAGESDGSSTNLIASRLVVTEKGSKSVHTTVRNPAGDSRSFDSPAQNEIGGVSKMLDETNRRLSGF